MTKAEWPNGALMQSYANIGDDPIAEARRAFEKKYGYKPEKVFKHGSTLYCGPIVKGKGK